VMHKSATLPSRCPQTMARPLVDRLLQQPARSTRASAPDQIMDSSDWSRSAGCILAKTTAIRYQDYQIHIVGRGHADFGGEVGASCRWSTRCCC
jgi:predicted membrane GTPase involved in stress response